ncbi:MAG: hypothetical protein ACODAG_09595 [Myxococcota bacterium]
MKPSIPERLRKLRFSGPYGLATGEAVACARPQPMVYRLFAWDGSTDGPRAIPRAVTVDEEGVLDIGESANGKRRLTDFLGAAQGKLRSHRAGWEYAVYEFTSTFPLDTLHVEILHVDSKELAEAIEVALLEDYRWRFNDRPPLNSSAGKPNKTVSWLQALGTRPRDDEGWLNLHPFLEPLQR